MTHRPPGHVRPDAQPDVVMMVCTAGHVDHGKTQLVKLLTGCNTDRLKIEQERGLTIELGFAPCLLGGNVAVGIVDVPGHEKFVKNMVAGVSGIGMTVLVIAADDGVMPQTVEHLQIMDLLGVRHGMVALTKTDLVSEDIVRQRVDEIGEFLKNTFLDGAPICPVSSETFEGFSEFYDTFVSQVNSLVSRRNSGLFRMPVERVFSQKGFGTVVSGIPVAGTVRVGDRIEIVPGGDAGRVRGLQCFLKDADEGGCGQCLALNLSDTGKRVPVRGDVVASPGCLKPARIFHVRASVVPGANTPLRNAEEIKFHTGTAEEQGKVYLLEGKTLEAGATAYATVMLTCEIVAAAHDRFIIRRPSPASTVAGGEIVAVTHGDRRPRKKVILGELREYEGRLGGADVSTPEGMARRIEHCLRTQRSTGASVQDISRDTLLRADEVTDIVSDLAEQNKLVMLGPDMFVHSDSYRACLDEIRARVDAVRETSGKLSVSVSELRAGLDWAAELWTRVFDYLEQDGLLTVKGEKVVLQSAADNLPEADRTIVDRLLGIYDETVFKSPRPEELAEMVEASPVDVDRLMTYLCDEGRLVRLSKNVILKATHFKQAQDMVVDIIRTDGELDSAAFKGHINSTRKYALAILDYLDVKKVTVRVGNVRKLAPNFERNLV
jgi:selenocysteine-specific elongation factor